MRFLLKVILFEFYLFYIYLAVVGEDPDTGFFWPSGSCTYLVYKRISCLPPTRHFFLLLSFDWGLIRLKKLYPNHWFIVRIYLHWPLTYLSPFFFQSKPKLNYTSRVAERWIVWEDSCWAGEWDRSCWFSRCSVGFDIFYLNVIYCSWWIKEIFFSSIFKNTYIPTYSAGLDSFMFLLKIIIPELKQHNMETNKQYYRGTRYYFWSPRKFTSITAQHRQKQGT